LLPDAEVEEPVAARLQRQQILDRAEPPRLASSNACEASSHPTLIRSIHLDDVDVAVAIGAQILEVGHPAFVSEQPQVCVGCDGGWLSRATRGAAPCRTESGRAPPGPTTLPY
jgi:hypothetical protein